MPTSIFQLNLLETPCLYASCLCHPVMLSDSRQFCFSDQVLEGRKQIWRCFLQTLVSSAFLLSDEMN
ncbi:hypothetical protein GUJ93_ZPchr0013g36726 [Zizania palustris]|uniref:Uncharacterized protein n=1 Tax=Zizania palustris TaxID=103762 RepID=A0A8J5X361_ZIZPA|nr:hypothetical protein GUJ93_ZPchr0013g36726 [Zizania palustris]